MLFPRHPKYLCLKKKKWNLKSLKIKNTHSHTYYERPWKNMTKTLLVETKKKFIGWVFVDPCGSIHRPPIQTRTEGARNSGVFCCHKYATIMGWFIGGDSCEFSVDFFFLWGDSWWFPWCDSLCDIILVSAESYGGGVLTERKINTFDGQSMTNFCMFKDKVKTYPNQ